MLPLPLGEGGRRTCCTFIDRQQLQNMFYPIFLNLEHHRIVVIGGGEVAERKIESLLDTGATITVISPEVTPRIATLSAQNRIELFNRAYASGDCAGAALVFSATGDTEIGKAIYAEA